MDYGEILSRAWKITWNNKILWLFGLFAGTGASLNTGNGGSGGGDGGGGFEGGPGGGLPPNIERQLERPEVIAIILAITGVLLLIVVALIVLSIIARGGLIGGIRLADDNGKVTFREAWSIGLRYFWRIFGMAIMLVAPILGEHWILYAFTSSSVPPGGTNYGRRIHVDSPRYVPNYPSNVGLIWTLDAFTEETGGTDVLPGSHHSPRAPSEEYFDRRCVQVECLQGSLIVFQARLSHRSGLNRSPKMRHALTLNACRAFMKQRMDWVRFVPKDIADALGPQGRRLLGYDTRLPTSLEEFFVPEGERLYKPNQG